MMASLFAGVSGLRNHQVKMNVIGNNIANINTIGFKSSRVNFQEALVQTIKGAGRPSSVTGGTNPIQLGLGMEVSAIDTLFLQGGLETTGQITDLAIQGNGFFILGDFFDNRFYARAGAFGFDASANLVDPATGLMVLGRMADTTGSIDPMQTLGMITLPFGQQDPAQETTEVTMVNNIDSSASDSVASLVDVGLSNVLSVSGTAADGVGGVHTISVTGSQALQSTFTSAGVAGGLSANGTLASYGVTIFNDFTLSVDGGIADTVSGLSGTSTVSDLLSAINQIEGVTAALVDIGGGVLQVEVTRTKAGDPVDYSFESSDSVAGNIVDVIFGVAPGVGNTFVSAGGAATTFVATDSFQPNRGSGPAAGPQISTLGLIIDNNSGLVTGLGGIGDSGIQILTATGGLATTIGPGPTDYPLLISTADTVHTSSIGVYDSQGGKHILSIQFFRSIVDNRWEWEISTLGDETITSGSTGYVSFNQDGSLNTFDYTGGATRVTIDPQNGAGNMEITFDAGMVGGYSGLTGFASGSHTATLNSQNGYGMGILEKISIDKAGYISGIFSNGITRVLAQIMLADFANQGGLRKTGKSLYQPTGNSGLAQVGVAGETIGGELFSGALESSSVDIAAEFTSMITAQRGFQANARIISTSDSMLDELVNIKR